jgi:hypothetical protein
MDREHRSHPQHPLYVPGLLQGYQIPQETVDAFQLDAAQIISGSLAVARGGLALTSIAAFETLYASAANVYSKLAPNTTVTKKYLRMTGDGVNGAAPAWDTMAFAELTSKPTTLAGYGITDAYTKAQDDTLLNAKLNLTGGTLTGNLLFTDNLYDIGASGATRPKTIWLTTGWDMNDGTVRATGLIEASRLDFGTVTNHDFGIFTNSTLRFRLTSAGHFVAHTDNAFDIGAAGANRPKDLYLAGQLKLEGTAPAIRFTNSVATGAVANSHNINVAPTGAASTIQGWLKISVNGTDRFIPFW